MSRFSIFSDPPQRRYFGRFRCQTATDCARTMVGVAAAIAAARRRPASNTSSAARLALASSASISCRRNCHERRAASKGSACSRRTCSLRSASSASRSAARVAAVPASQLPHVREVVAHLCLRAARGPACRLRRPQPVLLPPQSSPLLCERRRAWPALRRGHHQARRSGRHDAGRPAAPDAGAAACPCTIKSGGVRHLGFLSL